MADSSVYAPALDQIMKGKTKEPDMMTSKRRVIEALEFGEADRIPRYDSFWKQTVALYMESGLDKKLPNVETIAIDGMEREIGNPVEDYFGFDIDMLYIDTSLRMPYKKTAEENDFEIIEDHYGYTVKKFKDKSGSMHFLNHVTKDRDSWDDLKRRMIFNPHEKSRIDSLSYFLHEGDYPSWEGLKKIHDAYRKRDKYMLYACYGPWEGTWRHRGFTELLMDSALDPDWTGEMLKYHCDLTIDIVSYAISQGSKPDGIFMIEDLGSTRNTLISAEAYRSLLKPLHSEIAGFCHLNDMKLFMHSCGNIEPFIPDFIEAGIDVIQPLQANTGMDIVKLKKQFGESIVFFGNISAEILSQGKTAIEEEIRYKVVNAKRGGGYIYHSDHSIPDNVIFSDYEHAIHLLDKYGRYG